MYLCSLTKASWRHYGSHSLVHLAGYARNAGSRPLFTTAFLRDEVTSPSRTRSSLGYYKSSGVPIFGVPQQQPTIHTASS